LASRIPPLTKQREFRHRAVAALPGELIHDLGKFDLVPLVSGR